MGGAVAFLCCVRVVELSEKGTCFFGREKGACFFCFVGRALGRWEGRGGGALTVFQSHVWGEKLLSMSCLSKELAYFSMNCGELRVTYLLDFDSFRHV